MVFFLYIFLFLINFFFFLYNLNPRSPPFIRPNIPSNNPVKNPATVNSKIITTTGMTTGIKAINTGGNSIIKSVMLLRYVVIFFLFTCIFYICKKSIKSKNFFFKKKEIKENLYYSIFWNFFAYFFVTKTII